MKEKRLLLFLVLMSQWAFTQDLARIEFDRKSNSPDPIVISAGTKGMITITEVKVNSGMLNLQYYDTTFQEGWHKTIEYNKKLSLMAKEVFGDQLYLILNSVDRAELQLISVDVQSGDEEISNLSYFRRFRIKDFCVRNDHLYIAGMLKQLPIAIKINLLTRNIEPLPLAVDGKKVEVAEIMASMRGEVSVSVSFEKKGNKEVLIKSYYDNNQISDLKIVPKPDFDLLNGKMTYLGTKSKIVIGTYAFRNNASTQGFYISGYYDNKEVFKKYHGFTHLKNFFDFKSEKEQERIEAKIEKKESQGKEYKSKYRLLVHEVVQQGNNYIMLGEAYYPTYRSERVRRYTARGYYYTTRIVFDGYRYTHAVVASFNKKGNIVWDHSFKINDIKTMDLKEHVKMYASNEELKLVYNLEGKMNAMTIVNGEITDEQQSLALQTKYENDKIKFSDLGQSEYWYGNHFLAWGYQRIKNLTLEVDKKKRNVFYINKLTF